MARPYRRTPIEEIEGVAEARSAVLRQSGIVATEDLLISGARRVAQALKGNCGLTAQRLERYLRCARLMQLNGLTGQHAEALTTRGYDDLEEFASPRPERIISALDEAVSDGLIPESTSIDQAIRWQKEALRIALCGRVFGTVSSSGGPIAGAIVRCGWLLVAVGKAVTIGVDFVRVEAELFLFLVRQPVAVRVLGTDEEAPGEREGDGWEWESKHQEPLQCPGPT